MGIGHFLATQIKYLSCLLYVFPGLRNFYFSSQLFQKIFLKQLLRKSLSLPGAQFLFLVVDWVPGSFEHALGIGKKICGLGICQDSAFLFRLFLGVGGRDGGRTYKAIMTNMIPITMANLVNKCALEVPVLCRIAISGRDLSSVIGYITACRRSQVHSL